MLPLFQTSIKELSLLETQWKSQLDPVLNNPTTNLAILNNIALVNGNNVISHKLGQLQQGWIILDIDGAATVYRSAPFNNLTLTLHSSAAVTVKLGVF